MGAARDLKGQKAPLHMLLKDGEFHLGRLREVRPCPTLKQQEVLHRRDQSSELILEPCTLIEDSAAGSDGPMSICKCSDGPDVITCQPCHWICALPTWNVKVLPGDGPDRLKEISRFAFVRRAAITYSAYGQTVCGAWTATIPTHVSLRTQPGVVSVMPPTVAPSTPAPSMPAVPMEPPPFEHASGVLAEAPKRDGGDAADGVVDGCEAANGDEAVDGDSAALSLRGTEAEPDLARNEDVASHIDDGGVTNVVTNATCSGSRVERTRLGQMVSDDSTRASDSDDQQPQGYAEARIELLVPKHDAVPLPTQTSTGSSAVTHIVETAQASEDTVMGTAAPQLATMSQPAAASVALAPQAPTAASSADGADVCSAASEAIPATLGTDLGSSALPEGRPSPLRATPRRWRAQKSLTDEVWGLVSALNLDAPSLYLDEAPFHRVPRPRSSA